MCVCAVVAVAVEGVVWGEVEVAKYKYSSVEFSLFVDEGDQGIGPFGVCFFRLFCGCW